MESEVLVIPRPYWSALETVMTEDSPRSHAKAGKASPPDEQDPHAAWSRPMKHWPAETAWLRRADAEGDEGYLQIIPYALLRDGSGALWCYRRRGGDARLRERFSCGVGGHVDREDEDATLAATVWNALLRELDEELNWQPPPEAHQPLAWIYEGISPIGRVHAGLLYLLDWQGAEPPRSVDPALAGMGFLPVSEIIAEPRFELWSRLAARHVSECGE